MKRINFCIGKQNEETGDIGTYMFCNNEVLHGTEEEAIKLRDKMREQQGQRYDVFVLTKMEVDE
jgi:hypothetical protein